VPGVHLSGAKALAGSFAMSRFAGNSAPGKTPDKRPFAKAFCILSGLLPLAKCNISCSVLGEIYVGLTTLCETHSKVRCPHEFHPIRK